MTEEREEGAPSGVDVEAGEDEPSRDADAPAPAPAPDEEAPAGLEPA